VPGYKALPDRFDDDTAPHVRYAEVLRRAGDLAEAAHMLEISLAAYAETSPELPGWLCARLASLYRMLGRYEDEVRLLERFRDSQSSAGASGRFDARLSKVRAIAERKRRTETRALSSVRRVINGCEDEDLPMTGMPSPAEDAFSAETVKGLRHGFAAAGCGDAALMLSAEALDALLRESRTRGHQAEQMVVALKSAWRDTPRPPAVPAEAWDGVYRDALTRALADHFRDILP